MKSKQKKKSNESTNLIKNTNNKIIHLTFYLQLGTNNRKRSKWVLEGLRYLRVVRVYRNQRRMEVGYSSQRILVDEGNKMLVRNIATNMIFMQREGIEEMRETNLKG